MRVLFLFIIIFINTCYIFSQNVHYTMRPKALDIGVYDYSKVKKNSYKIYYEQEAEKKFIELLMQSERLKNSGIFGSYIKDENDSTIFFMEEEAYEYCPELDYVMKTGGHGYVSAYDLTSLEEIFVNPSTYVYSPSGKYRFGTFEYDGVRYYIEVKEGDKYIPYLLFYGLKGDISGVYWADDETIHYLKEKLKPDESKYWIAYSSKFYPVENKETE